MIFEQFLEPSLGHASYLLGSEETGEALVLDVRLDVDDYYQFARKHGLRIAYAVDTHQHNDYLTGITQLKTRGPVELLAGAHADLGYEARPFEDGERLRMGEIEFEFIHTPGHTPEHISLVVRDTARGDEPIMLLSGGALLVGDVGGPDFLGDEAEKRESAKTMCRTLREKVLTLPDHVLVYPTHVAGSLCGGNIGSMLVTTIGYERRQHEMLTRINDEKAFEHNCLGMGPLPTLPAYWRRMRSQNQAGPPNLGPLVEPQALQAAVFAKAISEGAVVVDCRSHQAFAGGFIPGALNIGAGDYFPVWAGSVIPDRAAVLLVVDNPAQLWDITWALLRIGYKEPVGWLVGGIQAWSMADQPLAFLALSTAKELDIRRQSESGLFILDVRQPAEWEAGHVPGARHISGSDLPQRLDEVPCEQPVVVYCGSGYRSSVAASVLMRSGRRDVKNMIGGFAAWRAANLPISQG